MKTILYDVTIISSVQHIVGLHVIDILLHRHHCGDYGVNGNYESCCIELIDAILQNDDDFTQPGLRNILALNHYSKNNDFSYNDDCLFDCVFSSYIVGCEEVWIITNLKRKFTLVALANTI